MILGITGNIASGKSTVADFFAEAGARILSADQLAREVVRPDGPVLGQLVQRFGDKILLADGGLDRAALAELVFADPDARRELNAITHPAIARLAEQRLQELDRSGADLIVYEAPLLFEAGAEGRVDRVLVVTVAPEVQLRRLMQRDALDESAARQRVAAQMPQAEKVRRADFVIDNSGSREACRRQVRKLVDRLSGPLQGRSENR